jgi:diacylglycerol kinase (ATP)
LKGRPLRERIRFAVAGWRAGWRREASFRSQILIAGAALSGLVVLRPQPIWWALVLLVVAMILALELLNSAIEAVIDLLHPGLHDEIKAAKDMVAGAVLLISVAALGIGLALVIDRGPSLLHELGVMR